MRTTIGGLGEAGLTLLYNGFLSARSLGRRLRRPTTIGVRVLVLDGERVLFVRHRGGPWPWSIPGGGIDGQESPADAALREVREEAGLEARLVGLLGAYHTVYQGMSNHVLVFICEARGPARAPRGDLEIAAAHLFDRRDLPRDAEPGSLRRLAEHDAGVRGLYGPW